MDCTVMWHLAEESLLLGGTVSYAQHLADKASPTTFFTDFVSSRIGVRSCDLIRAAAG